MPLAAPGALVEVDHVLGPPVWVVAVGHDDVGGLDEGPFQVGVALLDHAAVMGPPGAGADLRHQAAVAGEVVGRREALDGNELPIYDHSQHLGWPRDGLNELHGWSDLQAVHDPSLQL